MKSIAIYNMAEAGRDVRDEVAEVFVDGYYGELSYFTKDRSTLISAFKDLFSSEVFYVAERQGRIAGILACSNNRRRAMPVKLEPLQDAFGAQTGELAYQVMKNEFNTALPYDDGTGYIECVATLTRDRGIGISSALLNYVLEKLPYRRYILEVTDANEAAHRIYSKLGFGEFERKAEENAEAVGFKYRIYMEWTREN